MNRWRWAREMVDLVNLQQDRVDNIVPNKLEVGHIQKVLDVVLGSSEEVVNTDDLHKAWTFISNHLSRNTP